MNKWQKIIGVVAGAIVILFLVACYLVMFKPWLFMDYEPDLEYIQSGKEIICVNGQEWYIDYKSGGLLGNHECISISPNHSASTINDSSFYEFYTDEMYYTIDSLGRINIYAPWSSINEHQKKDSSIIIIHELHDYDLIAKYRKDYSALGLKRITNETYLKMDRSQ